MRFSCLQKPDSQEIWFSFPHLLQMSCMILCFISCSMWKMYLILSQGRREGWEVLGTAKAPFCSCSSPLGRVTLTALCLKLTPLLLPLACNCPATQHQDLGLRWNCVIWEEETLGCKAEADMPFSAIRFYRD